MTKLTRPQWEFLELVERTPALSPLGWRPLPNATAPLYWDLQIPAELLEHTYGFDSRGMLDKSVQYLRLLPAGKLLLKYGTCPK